MDRAQEGSASDESKEKGTDVFNSCTAAAFLHLTEQEGGYLVQCTWLKEPHIPPQETLYKTDPPLFH